MYFIDPPALKIVYVVTFPEPIYVYHDADWVRLCVVLCTPFRVTGTNCARLTIVARAHALRFY